MPPCAGTTWVIGRYGFHASRSIGPRGEFSETLGIERDLQVDQLVLSVHKRMARDPCWAATTPRPLCA